LIFQIRELEAAGRELAIIEYQPKLKYYQKYYFAIKYNPLCMK
jgi:hypothetical protein